MAKCPAMALTIHEEGKTNPSWSFMRVKQHKLHYIACLISSKNNWTIYFYANMAVPIQIFRSI